MSKLMALLGRFLFETHDAVRLRKQHYDTSDLEILSDIPYLDDGDAGHLFDIYRTKEATRARFPGQDALAVGKASRLRTCLSTQK